MNIKHNSQRNKSLGQNFITDEPLLDQLAELSGVTENDSVLEIGAGLGGLTAALAKRAKSVLAIEIDRSLEGQLRENLQPFGNVTLCIMDGMKFDWAQWASEQDRPVRFVSNLPYYITTPLLNRAFQLNPPFVGVACMVQKEVAAKLCARPGDDDYGSLSIWANLFYSPRVMMELPAAAFDPPPNVDSSFVVCDGKNSPEMQSLREQNPKLIRLIDIAFSSRRKTMRNNIRAGYGLTSDEADAWLLRAGIAPQARAETIPPDGFADLLRARIDER